MDHNTDEIASLLQIQRQAHESGFSNIVGAAAARLKQINEEMRLDGLGGPKVRTPQEIAADAAKIAAERQAEVDKVANENLKTVEQEEKDRIAAEALRRAQAAVPPVATRKVVRPPPQPAVGAPPLEVTEVVDEEPDGTEHVVGTEATDHDPLPDDEPPPVTGAGPSDPSPRAVPRR